MGRLVTLVLVSLIVVAGSIGIAPSAEAISSCLNAGDVTALGSAGCNLGSLNFTDFAANSVGMAAKIYLGAFSAVVGNNVNLSFHVAHSPSPATLSDIVFMYTVKTLSGLPELGGIDLYEDIQFGYRGLISEFMNSHDEPPVASPGPVTLLLLGGSLVVAGLAARRRTARKAAGARPSEGSRGPSASR